MQCCATKAKLIVVPNNEEILRLITTKSHLVMEDDDAPDYFDAGPLLKRSDRATRYYRGGSKR